MFQWSEEMKLVCKPVWDCSGQSWQCNVRVKNDNGNHNNDNEYFSSHCNEPIWKASVWGFRSIQNCDYKEIHFGRKVEAQNAKERKKGREKSFLVLANRPNRKFFWNVILWKRAQLAIFCKCSAHFIHLPSWEWIFIASYFNHCVFLDVT